MLEHYSEDVAYKLPRCDAVTALGEVLNYLFDGNVGMRTLPRVFVTSFRKVGRHYRRSEEIHRLRLYKASELARELRRVGFRVRMVRGYGELRFKPGCSGFVARKP